MVTPNPILGVAFHTVGAGAAANCYAPQRYIKRWSWETFWMVQAAWCWVIWPIVGALCTIPHLGAVLAEAPKLPMLYSFLMSLAFGVGGIAFNLSIRYIGFALTYAIAIGLSSVLPTLITPLARGQLGDIIAKPGSGWIFGGVGLGVLGIAICGAAGRLKEIDLCRSDADAGGFSLWKGLVLSLVAGILSAVYGFAIDVMQPVIDLAGEYAKPYGAEHWKGNVAYLFANTGAFVTSMVYCSYLAKKNRSLGELLRLPNLPSPSGRGAGGEGHGTGSSLTAGGSLFANYLLAMLVGTLWYAQFFFYNLGRVRMGEYAFTSWAIQMILLVLFSSLLGVAFREWKGSKPRTYAAIMLGMAVLVAAILLVTRGNYLGEQPAATTHAGNIQSTV